MSVFDFLLAGGVGYLLAKTQQGQIIQIPVQGTNLDAFAVFDELPAASNKDYERAIGYAGRVTSIWVQFYNTQGLLSHEITIDGTPVLSYLSGGLTAIALHQTSQTFPSNRNFDQGAALKVHSVNSDPTDLHRVRVAIFTQRA